MGWPWFYEVLSFSGHFLQLPTASCRLLKAVELKGYDQVLGPTSEPEAGFRVNFRR